MTEPTQIFSSKIYLFDGLNSDAYQRNNILKEFIYYLKFTGKKGMINFSFSGSEESFHPRLSIKENYILDSVPTSLIKDKEDNFQITAQNLENAHLKRLIQATECVNRIVKDLPKDEKKLVGVVKALLSQSEYVFMDQPDLFMSPELLKIIKEALIYEAEKNGRHIFIQPANKEKWLDVATHVVVKNEDAQYIKQPNRLCSLAKTSPSRSASSFHFQLVKKAG